MPIHLFGTDIVYLRHTDNFLDDLISRNAIGNRSDQVNQMSRPKDILVKKTYFNMDPSVKKVLKTFYGHK
jgi:hypothetical protein